jgi:integrase
VSAQLRRGYTLAFTDYLITLGLAPRSIAEYDKVARRYERWCYVHDRDPAELDPGALAVWADSLPYTWSTRKAAKTALRHYAGWLRVDTEPYEAIRVPRKPRPHNRALSREDARLLRDGALLVGGRKGLAVLIGLYTAARRGEIARMRWDGWADGMCTWSRTKTSDTLTVPIHPILAGVLAEHKPQATSVHIFPGDQGRPHVTEATVWSWVTSVGDTVGVKVTPHQLRHTALSTAYDTTKDLRAVQDLAGHRDPSVTAIYTRTTGERLAAVVDALDY